MWLTRLTLRPWAHIEPFVRKKLPQLLKLMSAARRSELQGRD
jgi:hypothetical protein